MTLFHFEPKPIRKTTVITITGIFLGGWCLLNNGCSKPKSSFAAYEPAPVNKPKPKPKIHHKPSLPIFPGLPGRNELPTLPPVKA